MKQRIPSISPNNNINTLSPSKLSNPQKARRVSIAADAPKTSSHRVLKLKIEREKLAQEAEQRDQAEGDRGRATMKAKLYCKVKIDSAS